MTATGICIHCSKSIRFDSAKLGEVAACPHCGVDSVLREVPDDALTDGAAWRRFVIGVGAAGVFMVLGALVVKWWLGR